MKNIHPLRAERRRQRRLALLDTENPCCAMCGETSLECLEIHEIAGFKRDPNTRVIVCRNCHRKLTSRLMDAGIPMLRENCPLQRTGIGDARPGNSRFGEAIIVSVKLGNKDYAFSVKVQSRNYSTLFDKFGDDPTAWKGTVEVEKANYLGKDYVKVV